VVTGDRQAILDFIDLNKRMQQQEEMDQHTYTHNEPCTGASAASTVSCHNLTKGKLVRIQTQQQQQQLY